jgi:hypothetical protein
MLVCGQLIALSTNAWIEEHRWVLVAWLVMTLLAPFALQHFGVLETTWTMTPQGLLTTSGIIDTHGVVDLWGVVIAQVALGVVVAIYAVVITRAWRVAQREAYIQAWHLQRMVLPR